MAAKKKRRARAGAGPSSRPPRPPKPRPPRRVDPADAAELAASERAPAGGASIARWTLAGVVALAALAATLLLLVYPSTHGPGAGREVELALVGDESPDALAGKLAGAGLVASPGLFAVYARASGVGGHVAPGAHLFTDDLSPREVLERVAKRGAARRARVTVPEGFTRFDIAKRLQAARVAPQRAFLDASADPALLSELRIEGPSAEGYLFPATYELAEDSLPADVIRRMKAEFDKRYTALEERHDASLLDLASTLGWKTREIVTLASMIEKEAVMDDERPIIAGVFVNRLRDPKFTPHLLQCDPTAGYGCLVDGASLPSCAAYAGKITHELVVDAQNPYNTYKHEGLPPGPISNPGARSLEAAMAPSSTRYLYFVAKGGGRHAFSETYGAHAAAVEESNKR